MLHAQKELSERVSKSMLLQTDCDRLEKQENERIGNLKDLNDQLATLRSGKAANDLEKIRTRVRAEEECSAKTKEMVSRMVYTYDEHERDKTELEQAVRDGVVAFTEISERVKDANMELKQVEKELKAKKMQLFMGGS